MIKPKSQKNLAKAYKIRHMHEKNLICFSAVGKESLYMNLNISSLSYHHQEVHTLLCNLRVKPKILAILESRIKNDGLFLTLACRITLMSTSQQKHQQEEFSYI